MPPRSALSPCWPLTSSTFPCLSNPSPPLGNPPPWQIIDITITAVNEADIERKLAAIDEAWTARLLPFQVDFKDRAGAVVLHPSTQDVVADLEETQLLLNSLLSSRFVEFFRASVEDWQAKLTVVSEQLDRWLAVQVIFGCCCCCCSGMIIE